MASSRPRPKARPPLPAARKPHPKQPPRPTEGRPIDADGRGPEEGYQLSLVVGMTVAVEIGPHGLSNFHCAIVTQGVPELCQRIQAASAAFQPVIEQYQQAVGAAIGAVDLSEYDPNRAPPEAAASAESGDRPKVVRPPTVSAASRGRA